MFITGKDKLMLLTALDMFIQCCKHSSTVIGEYETLEAKIKNFDAEGAQFADAVGKGYQLRKREEEIEAQTLMAQVDQALDELEEKTDEEIAEEFVEGINDDEAINIFHALADRLGCGVTFPGQLTEKGKQAVDQWTPEEIEQFKKNAAAEADKVAHDLSDPAIIDEVFEPLKGDGFSGGEHATGNAEVIQKAS